MPRLSSVEWSARYGPWALVTGASEGIGRSLAQALAQRGMNLLLVARRGPLLESLAAELRASHGVQCEVLAADLAEPAGLQALLQRAAALDLGLVVCNAGFGTAGSFLASDVAKEDQMLALNCQALMHISHSLGRQLQARGRGGLVLLSSIVAFQGVARSAHYAATKAYVQALGEGLQQEWQGSGVDVLLVAPGPVATGFEARSGMRLGQAEQPAVVAQQTLAALGRQRLLRPGRLAKWLGWGLAAAPRAWRVRIMSQVMRGMTRRLP